jgi:hypothetical protein
MRKLILSAFVLLALQVEAQVKFMPGIRAGVNFSKLTQSDLDGRTDFYVSALGAIQFNRKYTLQPEIGLSNQGAKGTIDFTQQYYDPNSGYYTSDIVRKDIDVKLQYLTFSAINKFTVHDHFIILVGPTLDFIMNDTNASNSDVDFCVTAGLGYKTDFGLTIEARVKKGIADVLDSDYEDNYNDDYFLANYNTNLVFQFGLSYAFDLK